MNEVPGLQRCVEELATAWGEALKFGDHRTANRRNAAITKIVRKFKKDKGLGEDTLVPLLRHPNASVRLLASVHALDLGIHIRDAERTLTDVANDPNIHVVQLMAKINLRKWNEKKIAKGEEEPTP